MNSVTDRRIWLAGWRIKLASSKSLVGGISSPAGGSGLLAGRTCSSEAEAGSVGSWLWFSTVDYCAANGKMLGDITATFKWLFLDQGFRSAEFLPRKMFRGAYRGNADSSEWTVERYNWIHCRDAAEDWCLKCTRCDSVNFLICDLGHRKEWT